MGGGRREEGGIIDRPPRDGLSFSEVFEFQFSSFLVLVLVHDM